MTVNYIPDQNLFSLAGPPDWWMKKLWDFDSSLVVVPSRQQCIYRLAQRRRLKLPDHIVNDALFNESDTKMLARYSLVPVTTILPTANWSDPYLFIELANRAPHRQGGADEVIKRLEAQEAKEELDRQMQTDELNTSLAKDAWGLYNKKIGVRSHMYIPKSRQSGLTIPTNRSAAIKIK